MSWLWAAKWIVVCFAIAVVASFAADYLLPPHRAPLAIGGVLLLRGGR